MKYNFFITSVSLFKNKLSNYKYYLVYFFIFLYLFNNFYFMYNRDIDYFPLHADSTLFNYLITNGNNMFFSITGYPAFGVENYQPGPFPYYYLLELAFTISNISNISVFYLFNNILHFFVVVLVLLTLRNFFLAGGKNLLLSASFMLALTTYFTEGSRFLLVSERIDVGTSHLVFLSLYFGSSLYLSYKNRTSSHISLLFSSSLLLQSHFLGIGFGGLGLLLGIYLIIKNKIRNKKILTLQYFTVFLNIPLFIRFLSDPLFLLDSTKSSGLQVDRYYINDKNILFDAIYSITPLQYFCEADSVCSASPFSTLLILLFFTFLLSLLVINLTKLDFSYKIFTILSVIYSILVIIRAHEYNHLAILSGLIIFIIIVYLSKFRYLPIVIILGLFYISFNFNISDNEKNFKLFSDEYIAKFNNESYKFDMCAFAISNDCKNLPKTDDNIFKTFTHDGNAVSLFFTYMLFNKVDICIEENRLDLGSLNYLKCNNRFNDKRIKLQFIPFSINNPLFFSNFTKIGYLIDINSLLCKDAYKLDTHCSKNLYPYKEKNLYNVAIYADNSLRDDFYNELLDIDNKHKLQNPLFSYKGFLLK
jgi:hypothetical protein